MPDLAFDVDLVLAVVSILLFVGLIGYFGYLVRHQEQVEPEEKPVYGVELLEQHYPAGATVEQPTPYFVSPIPASPDPLEIAGNLDKKIVIGAAMLFFTFAFIGGYFVIQGEASPLREGGLRAAAVEHQLRQDVRRGKVLYAQFCYDCHGREGRGGTTPAGEQLPGLPLNKPTFKYEQIKEDPAAVGDTRRLLENTIARGREFAPPRYSMPAWARSEGGPLSQWQVKQLADLIMYGTDEDWADIPHVRVTHGEPPPPLEEQIPPPPSVRSGEEVFRATCGVCHTVTAGAPSPNPLAPTLESYGTRGPLVDELKRLKDSGDPDWLVKWITNAPEIKPGTAMPPYGASAGGTLSEEAVRAVADYLMKLGTQ